MSTIRRYVGLRYSAGTRWPPEVLRELRERDPVREVRPRLIAYIEAAARWAEVGAHAGHVDPCGDPLCPAAVSR